MKALRPFFVILALVLVVGLACQFGGNTNNPPAQPPVQQQSSEAPPQQSSEAPPPPTEVPPTAEAMSSESSSEASSESGTAPDFYREEFDGDISNYSYFEYHETYESREKNTDIVPTTKNGSLVFDLQTRQEYIYVTYDPYIYDNVQIEVKADNRGKNTNNVSLICRYSDEGWYEFNIYNSGLYDIFAFDETGIIAKGYNRIANGGSTAIKQGRETNVYTVICNDNVLSLYVNGVEVKTIKENKFKFREGLVGFGVSSFDVTPIIVNVDYFDISQP